MQTHDFDASLPDDCELLRYASPRQVDGDVVSGEAFLTKPKDLGELSTNRLGVFSNDLDTDLATVRRIRAQWLALKKNGRFAQISVAELQRCAAEASKAFSYRADPVLAVDEGFSDREDDPSHSVVIGIPDGDEDSAVALRDMISMRISRLHAAIVE